MPTLSVADAAALEALPDTRAVFALLPRAGGEPYLARCAHLRTRLGRLLAPVPAGARSLSLDGVMDRLRYTLVNSELEADLQLLEYCRAYFPGDYRSRLHLRLPVMLKLHLGNAYPRLYATRGIAPPPGLSFGPFPSRAAAERWAAQALDLFLLRRCADDLHPDPQFPGCMYSEMKMCLAPCFQGCSDLRYAEEVQRVQGFLGTRGESSRLELSAERDQASRELAFESAAALHLRLDKLTTIVKHLPGIARAVDNWNGAVVLPGRAGAEVVLFALRAGGLHGPLRLSLAPPTTTATHQPLEHRLCGRWTAMFPPGLPRLSRRRCGEHLALLARWQRRSLPMGELLFWPPAEAPPWRRLVSASAKVGRAMGDGAGETPLAPS